MAGNHRYSFNVFWSSEDEAYIATCPEFPRISAFGDTSEEALRSMEEVIQQALATYQEEGWALPEPTDLAQFSGKFQVRLSRSQHASLARRAEAEGVSMNALIAQYVSAGLARDEITTTFERKLGGLLDRIEQAAPTRPPGSSMGAPISGGMRKTG